MRAVNKVLLIGHLGKDPEFQILESNTPLARVSLATSETYKDRAGVTQSRTDWHNLVFWGKLAELAKQYLKRGSHVYVEGSIQYREWEDQEKNKRYGTDIVVREFTMLDKKPDTGATTTTTTTPQIPQNRIVADSVIPTAFDDGTPF